ncbi:META domain-containing protein [Aquihabitans sp. G128]|uniref:META domain-containing protein n=1 Tax=Aquihabitans sp. G128 TaxID=2849779 RepID=UPI001C24F7BD|nr:META domain-containing protein [Aquihabitans sp. G128]QXC60113.1 META domain-containing protein [Aquihabitans sp. G128]
MSDDDRSDHHEEPTELPLAPDGPASGIPRPGRAWVVAVVLVLVVALAGGAWALATRDEEPIDTGGSPGGGATAVWGHRWSVRDLEGSSAPALAPIGADRRPVLDTSVEGTVSFTGCNGGFGTGRLEGANLVLDGSMASTDMACTDAAGTALMAFDAWMAELLASSPTVGVSGDVLTIRSRFGAATFDDLGGPLPATSSPADPDGSVSSDDPAHLPDPGSGSVVTTPAVEPGGSGGGRVGSSPASPGQGQDWQVTAITVDGADRPVLGDQDGNPLVLDLTALGRVGFNGCNGGGADAHVDGGKLVVGGVVSTKLACSGPDGEALMAQDAWFGSFLEGDPELAVDGGTLTLTSGGSTVVAERVG